MTVLEQTWGIAPADLPRWQAEVAALYPPSERLSWLHLDWHPEVARLVIYQCLPPLAVPSALWREDQSVLRWRNHWIPDPRSRLCLDRRHLDHVQWRLYEQFGTYAQPYWILQGTGGGHRRRFSATEARLLRVMGHAGDAPLPGDLPYAPFDGRVLEKLGALDRMQMWRKAIDLYEREPEAFDAEEQEALDTGRDELNRWLAEQVDHAVDDVTTYKRSLTDMMRE